MTGEIKDRIAPHLGGGHVAWVTVDRADKLNILDEELSGQLAARIGALSEDADLRVLVLRGAGARAFIGGADINQMVDLEPVTARRFIRALHSVCAAITACPVPVIGRIQGYCLGGGFEVAAACDMRIAGESARFGMPEVAVGMPSVIDAALIPRLIGWGKTNELLYTGRLFDATEALACGFIERAAPDDGLDEALQDWLDQICNAGPRAIRDQKALIRRWQSLPLDEAIEAGVETYGRAFETDEPRRYMQKFLKH